MTNAALSSHALAGLRRLQQEEVDSHAIYLRIARTVTGPNRAVLERIAADELKHARVWESYTKIPCTPNRLRVAFAGLVAKLLGFTFIVKFLENGEVLGQELYARLEA